MVEFMQKSTNNRKNNTQITEEEKYFPKTRTTIEKDI
jgi:hypothetical protein